MGIRCSLGYDSSGKMWDRYRKTINHNFGRKVKSTGYIYLPGYKYRESEGHLKLRSFLQDAVINSTSAHQGLEKL